MIVGGNKFNKSIDYGTFCDMIQELREVAMKYNVVIHTGKQSRPLTEKLRGEETIRADIIFLDYI